MQVVERMSQVSMMYPVREAISPPTSVRTVLTLVLAHLGCALATSFLLWAGFYPINQGWVAWFALVPLLALIRSTTSTRRMLLASYVSGFVFFLAALNWMRVAHPMMVWAWIALAFYCALYFPLGAWLLRRLDRAYHLPYAIALPIVWTSLEFLRAHFLTGFPWYFVGLTQHGYLPMIQIADLGGVYAVSFVVLAVNGLVFELLAGLLPLKATWRFPISFSRKSLAIQAAAVVLLFWGCVGYGFWRLSQDADFSEGPRLALLQTNVAQEVKNSKHDEGAEGASAVDEICRQTQDLTGVILRENQNPDLVVWPETTFPWDWFEAEPGTPAGYLPTYFTKDRDESSGIAKRVAGYSKAHILLGLNTCEFGADGRKDRFNSALLVQQNGNELGRYDKVHRVLFGEYVPLVETLPWMSTFTPYDHDYSLSEGKRWTRFRLPTSRGEFRFGVLICYEDSISPLARRYARQVEDERPVDFLVNISNDGWFDGTEEHEQHLAVCRFRAVETRRAVARAVNMGISAVIDGNGRIVALPAATWAESKKMAAAFTATVPIDARTSWYAQIGDWFAAGCAALSLLGIVGTFVRGSKRRA